MHLFTNSYFSAFLTLRLDKIKNECTGDHCEQFGVKEQHKISDTKRKLKEARNTFLRKKIESKDAVNDRALNVSYANCTAYYICVLVMGV